MKMGLIMRKIALALLAAATLGIGSAGAASAADLPVKSRYVDTPQAFSWSGFYVGLHGGYGWGSSDWTLNGTSPASVTTGTSNPRSKGFLGGIQVGANHQLAIGLPA
jgi:outer membrane immunogenic protein